MCVVGKWLHRHRFRTGSGGRVRACREAIDPATPARLIAGVGAPAAGAVGIRKSRAPFPAVMEVEGCALPEDRLYDLEHDVWLQPSEDRRTATVGILASLASFAGRFHTVGFRDIEGVISGGRSVATVESVRYTGAVRLPVDGRVVERNAALVARPKLLNDAPYGEGWVVVIAPVRPVADSENLVDAAGASERLAARIRELRIRCYPAAPDVEVYEIGAECAAILARLDEELAPRPADDVVLLVTDDPTSPIEMIRWTDRTGHSLLAHRKEGNLHHFLIRKEAHPTPRIQRR